MASLLELVKNADSVPYSDEPGYNTIQSQCYKFLSHDGVAIGTILPFVAQQLKNYPQALIFDEKKKTIAICPSLNTAERRTEAISTIVNKWRKDGTFGVLKGWRNELYVIYNPSHIPYMMIERAASSLFGVVTYGVHIVGYVPGDRGEDMRIWVPRRSFKKPTFPGMLDNTVAGGLGHPYGITETVIKECGEEAGLEESYVTSHITPTGVVTYSFRTEGTIENENGLFQPEVEYTFDLLMEREVTPKVVDGEVEEFNLMTISQVMEELAAGNFKYNTAMVTIEFFIRHGIITSEDEVDYVEILNRCHRRLEFPLM